MARQFPIYRFMNRSTRFNVRNPRHKHVFQRGDVDRMVDHIIGKITLRPQWRVILSAVGNPTVMMSDLVRRINKFHELNTENIYAEGIELGDPYVRTGIGTTEMYLSPTGLEYIPGNSKVAAILVRYKGYSGFFEGGRSMIPSAPQWHVDYGRNRILFWNTRGVTLNENTMLIPNSGKDRRFIVTGAEACDWKGNTQAIKYSSPFRNIWGGVAMQPYTRRLLYGDSLTANVGISGDISARPELDKTWGTISTNWNELKGVPVL